MNTATEMTEAEAAAEAAAKAARKAEEKAAAKAARDAAKAEEKAAKTAAKEAEKAAKAQARAEAKALKEAEKAATKEAKAQKMPESNGVRRPKPETMCGRAWAIFDEVSAANGGPAAIKDCLEIAKSRKLNEGNVRVEYARWRKFYGITGRISAKADVTENTAEAA